MILPLQLLLSGFNLADCGLFSQWFTIICFWHRLQDTHTLVYNELKSHWVDSSKSCVKIALGNRASMKFPLAVVGTMRKWFPNMDQKEKVGTWVGRAPHIGRTITIADNVLHRKRILTWGFLHSANERCLSRTVFRFQRRGSLPRFLVLENAPRHSITHFSGHSGDPLL